MDIDKKNIMVNIGGADQKRDPAGNPNALDARARAHANQDYSKRLSPEQK